MALRRLGGQVWALFLLVSLLTAPTPKNAPGGLSKVFSSQGPWWQNVCCGAIFSFVVFPGI